MQIVLGDLHLTNDSNDKYHQMFDRLSYLIKEINENYFYGKMNIDNITFLGDVMDCEYITYLKVVYFNDMLKYIKQIFPNAKKIKLLIGNHDKYSTFDNQKNNILKYFHEDVISSPTIEDDILYLPHFYDKNNIDLSIFNDKIKIILAHAGTKDVFGDKELTVEDISKHFNKKVPIISGHLHTVKFNNNKNYYIIGSMKTTSFNDSNLCCYACLLDENKENILFLQLPYYKVFQIIAENDEEQIKNKIENIIKELKKINTTVKLLTPNGDIVFEKELPENDFFTKILNIRFEIDGSLVKPTNIGAILEMIIHDESFYTTKVNSVFSLTKSKQQDNSPTDILNIDEIFTKTNEILPEIKNFFIDLKNSQQYKSQKIKKYLDSVSEDELNSFARYLAFMKFELEFEELKKTGIL